MKPGVVVAPRRFLRPGAREPAMESGKDRYLRWSAGQPDIPIFSRGWWLDAVCDKGEWDVVLFEDGGRIVAALPFHLKRRGPFSIVTMPQLTPILGPFIAYPPGLSHAKRLSLEKRVLTDMIARLPPADHLVMACHSRLTNWLPFHWAGFSQSTAYTYTLDLTDLDGVFAGFQPEKKRSIRRAQERVQVGFGMDADGFWHFHRNVLRKRGRSISYPLALFRRVHAAVHAQGAGSVIHARDEKGRVLSALFTVWGPEGAYSLINATDPEFAHSGALALLVQESIRNAARQTRRFDFEGSMIEGVESVFRHFGGVQTPYFMLTCTASPLLRLRVAARSVLRLG